MEQENKNEKTIKTITQKIAHLLKDDLVAGMEGGSRYSRPEPVVEQHSIDAVSEKIFSMMMEEMKMAFNAGQSPTWTFNEWVDVHGKKNGYHERDYTYYPKS